MYPTIKPHWVWLAGKTINTLHSHRFTRLQAIEILTHCIGAIATEEQAWEGDAPETATTAPDTERSA